jgi:hypothetical protein
VAQPVSAYGSPPPVPGNTSVGPQPTAASSNPPMDGPCAPGRLDEAMRLTNDRGVDAVGSLAYDDAHA